MAIRGVNNYKNNGGGGCSMNRTTRNKPKNSDLTYLNVSKVNVSFGYTFNVGDYESKRIDLGMEVIINEDDNVGDVVEKAYGQVERFVLSKR